MKHWKALAATHLAVGVGGYALAPTTPLDTEVKHSGFFTTTDTRRVLATTVESLKAENRLQVFSYRGSTTVSVERSVWWLFGGNQTLMVPATVSYFLDLSQLTLRHVTYDERSKVVRVELPPVAMGDVGFQPEAAVTVNGGILTFSEEQVEELRKQNYANARRAFIAQAQSPSLIQVARRQAQRNIVTMFELPLRIAGQPDVRVVATFRQS